MNKEVEKKPRRLLEIARIALEDLADKASVSQSEILEQARQSVTDEVPAELFSSQGLSALEALCLYFSKVRGFGATEIGRLIGRDARVVWTVLKHARSKKASLKTSGKTWLPISIFSADYTVLESAIVFMHDSLRLRFVQIGSVIGRDPRNVWSTYRRVKAK